MRWGRFQGEKVDFSGLRRQKVGFSFFDRFKNLFLEEGVKGLFEVCLAAEVHGT